MPRLRGLKLGIKLTLGERGLGKNQNAPIEGIETNHWLNIMGSPILGKNQNAPIEGIETLQFITPVFFSVIVRIKMPRLRGLKHIDSKLMSESGKNRKNQNAPIEGIETLQPDSDDPKQFV